MKIDFSTSPSQFFISHIFIAHLMKHDEQSLAGLYSLETSGKNLKRIHLE